MQEIWIPELLIGFLLFLHITRPVVKSFDLIDGFAWLPLVALIIAILLFPAYGFRPELIPLLIFTIVLTIASVPRQLKDGAKYGNFRKRKIIIIFPPLIILAVTIAAAFYFTPEKDTAYRTSGVYTLRIPADSPENAAAAHNGKQEYFIRVYTDNADSRPTQRPLLVLMPPILGSLAAVDQVSEELCKRGFTVLTYSRRGFDSPAIHISGGIQKRYGISAAEWFRRVYVFFARTVSAKTYLWGKAMEEIRTEDLLFLLYLLRQNPLLDEKQPLFHYASRNAVFFAGYDAGGAALILQEASLSHYGSGWGPLSEIRIRGFMAIESSLYSVYREEATEIPELPPEAGWLASVKHGLNNWRLGMKPKKVTGPGQIPEVSFPFLFLISGNERLKAMEKGLGNRYPVMSGAFKAARNSAELVFVDNAGPLDYSDFPSRFPFITTLLHGPRKAPWNDAPAGTAGIITNFAASVLERENGFPSSLKNAALPEGTQIISR